jgi:hypothetical protein
VKVELEQCIMEEIEIMNSVIAANKKMMEHFVRGVAMAKGLSGKGQMKIEKGCLIMEDEKETR